MAAAKATSIAAMNAAIIAKLKEVPEVGYHVDDLAKSLNASTKKEVQARLYDLQNKGEVQRLPGNKWRLTPTAAAEPAATPATAAAPQAIPVNTHPSIKLPGITGFASYKNSLQEYCQKLHYAVPQYNSEKTSGGFVTTVNFGTNVVKGSQGRASSKESDQQAAFEALIALEYLPREAVFQEASKIALPGQKRKNTDAVPMDGATPAKQVTVIEGANQYKSKLNELAQKNKLPAPVYETVGTPNGFFSTVTFNGKPFKSSVCSKKKKDSEQNAAHMAMFLLQQVTSPPEGYNPAMGEGGPNDNAIESMIAEARATTTEATPATPTQSATAASAKNRLQEYCQRMKLSELPKYSTDVRQDKTVISTVVVAMSSYTGDVNTSKKGAEQSAAMKALLDLGLAAGKAAENGAAENGAAMQVEA